MSTNPQWRKSSRSAQANACVEVATNIKGTALVRDSKLGDASPILGTSPEMFAVFISGVKSGRFDG